MPISRPPLRSLRGLLPLSCLLISVVFLAGNARAQTAEQNTYVRLVREGADLLARKDYRAARDRFEDATRYYDADGEAYLGIGIASLHLGDDASAERALRQALDRSPRDKRALVTLGELFYRKDDIDSAVQFWERAAEADPSDAGLRARLERLRREQRTERDFSRDVTSHFSIKYEGRERIEAGKIVLRVLEDAYSEVGRALSFYPDRDILVILYSGQQFQEVTDAPGWSGGVFDGKIRLPIGGIDRETPALRSVLFHEYTHAVVRAITPRVPTWLNEGLAQYSEGRELDARSREFLRSLARSGKLPSLRFLEGPFTGLSGEQAHAAYLISLSAVRYMGDQFGLYRVRMVLDELAAGADSSRAVNNALLISYDDFERGWKRSLE